MKESRGIVSSFDKLKSMSRDELVQEVAKHKSEGLADMLINMGALDCLIHKLEHKHK